MPPTNFLASSITIRRAVGGRNLRAYLRRFLTTSIRLTDGLRTYLLGDAFFGTIRLTTNTTD